MRKRNKAPESAPAPLAGARLSSSSKNTTQGRARLALANTSRTCMRVKSLVSACCTLLAHDSTKSVTARELDCPAHQRICGSCKHLTSLHCMSHILPYLASGVLHYNE